MSKQSIQPEDESLRLAVKWLSDNRPITKARIEEASRRFDLAPLEVAFLLRAFLETTE